MALKKKLVWFFEILVTILTSAMRNILTWNPSKSFLILSSLNSLYFRDTWWSYIYIYMYIHGKAAVKIQILSSLSCKRFSSPLIFLCSRDSSVGIATRYGLDGPGIQSRWGARFYAPLQTGPGAHPSFFTMGTGSFPGVKRPARGADPPPPSLVPRY